MATAIILEEWTRHPTAALIANKWLEIGDGYRAKNDEMSEQGLPFIRAGDVNGRVNTQNTDLLGAKSLQAVGSKRSRPGDVVLTTKGTVGRMAFVEDDDPAFVYSPQLCFWRSLEPREICARWLYYALQAPEMRGQMAWSAAQTDMAPYISLGDQRGAFHITLPPIAAQEAAAEILGAIDAKIDVNRQMTATLEETARALFQSWFVDFDPVHAKAEGRDPALSADIAALFPDRFGDDGLPEGWAMDKVGALFDIVAGNTPSTFNEAFWGAPHAWATPKDMSSLRSPILDQTSRQLTGTGLGAASSGLVPAGSLLLSSRAPIGYLAFAAIPLAINQGIAAFVKKEVSTVYAWAWCQAHMDVIKSGANGSTFQEISKGTLRQLPMLRPTREATQRFDEITSSHYKRILQISCEIEALTQIRSLLLPKLISGDLRIPSAANEVAAA